MSARLQTRIDQARDVAAYLREIGEPFRAEQILSLCRSAAGSMETNSRLHHDIRVLRGELPPAEPASQPQAAPGPAPAEAPKTAIWCDQCEQRVSTFAARACGSPWCKARAAA